MRVSARSLAAWCVVAVLTAGCAQTVTGTAVRSPPGLDDDSRSPVDVDTLMLTPAQMRAIAGADEKLTAIPGMDGKMPVDIDQFTQTMPPQCAWVFAETQTFGPEVEEFRKTTYQYPPQSGLISQGVAGYRDADTARNAFDALVELVTDCDTTPLAPMFIGDWSVGPDRVHTRTGERCGRDYRVKSAVLVEVTFCGFPDSVPDIMMTNILARVPG